MSQNSQAATCPVAKALQAVTGPAHICLKPAQGCLPCHRHLYVFSHLQALVGRLYGSGRSKAPGEEMSNHV
ncbi:hypothetical protein I79_020675 [Cricetulus griseus]|uniref:Uncharacterized protein n=1 Tax=Cricetulus griseus TaxID=10029 RepID=G3IAP9_CRIGR|nr:hypothetical protein I79_020675 [Cricetulus griseus]